jgi:hypothetical protein
MGKGPQKAADCPWMLKHHDTINDAEQLAPFIVTS